MSSNPHADATVTPQPSRLVAAPADRAVGDRPVSDRPGAEPVDWSSRGEPVDPNDWESVQPLAAPHAAHHHGAVPPHPGRHWRLAPRSLTGRLVAGVVALVVVLVLSTGTGTFLALRAFLFTRLDQQVESTASGSLNELFFGSGPSVSPSSVRAPQFVWAVALDINGNVRAQPIGGTVEDLNLSPGDRRMLARHGATPITIHTTDHLELRVTTRTAPAVIRGRTVPVVAVIGLSTDEVNRTLHRLVELESAIGAAAVILALGATAYGVRFSLRRLYEVTDTARDVAAELSPEGTGLDRRVPVTEPGTEVGQLAESMNTLLATVETQFAARLASEQRMRQFLADASHELRTPLTSIRGYAELARIQRAQGDPEAADNLERIESEGTRMSRLVDDLLTLARSDRGEVPQRDWVAMDALLDEAVSGARAAYPDRRIEATADPGLHVLGDRDQLLRAVRNLLTNAAVHTRADGPIRVTAEPDRPEGSSIVVQVVDSGPGLPREEAAHVFERFWRADKARTRARGGSGLGLAIVASIVHAHGGTVLFQSTVEGGSTVTLRLPIGAPSAMP